MKNIVFSLVVAFDIAFLTLVWRNIPFHLHQIDWSDPLLDMNLRATVLVTAIVPMMLIAYSGLVWNKLFRETWFPARKKA